MTVEIRLLGPGETAALDRVADDVFDNPVDPAHTAAFLGDPRNHLWVARDDGVVIGFASALSYVHPDKPWTLWVNEVSVAPSHRRRGIGKELMAALLAHARTLGYAEAWLATEGDNTAARALYRAAGGRETPDIVMAEFTLAP